MFSFASILFLCFLAANAMIALIILPELSSLPSAITVLSRRALRCPSYFLFATSLAILIVIFPLFLIAFIHAYFKRYIFESQKPIKTSYRTVTFLLCISYMSYLFLFLIELMLNLAYAKIEFYFYVRLSKIHPSFFSMVSLYSLVVSMLIHTAVFILCFLLAEVFLAYTYFNTRQSMNAFIKRNITGIVFVLGSISMYFLTYFQFAKYIYKTDNPLGTTEQMYYGVSSSLVLMYVYVVLSLYG